MKRWTEEEEKILLKIVQKKYYNIKLALEEAAQTLDRTYPSVLHHYYQVVSKRKDTTAFFTFSKGSYLKNRKFCRKNALPQEHKNSLRIWQQIVKLFNK